MDLQSVFARLGGITPVVGTQFIPLAEHSLAAIETSLGVRFPESYRTLLAAYGASGFEEYTDYQPVRPFPPGCSCSGVGHFGFFYGSEDPAHEEYGLLTRIQYFSGRIPDNLTPIADNGIGDQICLCIRGEGAGAIYLWDQQNEPLDENDYLEEYGKPRPPEVIFQNVHLIADSFDDFLNRLEVSKRA